jgi:hypothetical protein
MAILDIKVVGQGQWVGNDCWAKDKLEDGCRISLESQKRGDADWRSMSLSFQALIPVLMGGPGIVEAMPEDPARDHSDMKQCGLRST